MIPGFAQGQVDKATDAPRWRVRLSEDPFLGAWLREAQGLARGATRSPPTFLLGS